uniref:Uncharacterized protein n=1 Tax=Romanomermis culicivorax TaxID=13658 RepID=A0A915KEZ1_ROMCU
MNITLALNKMAAYVVRNIIEENYNDDENFNIFWWDRIFRDRINGFDILDERQFHERYCFDRQS